MKSDKQRILEAYSEDLKSMYTESAEETNSSDVKKWVVDTPVYVKEKHNIVDAYAMLAEGDNYRANKMAILNEAINLRGKASKLKEAMETAEKDMNRYAEGSELADVDKFNSAEMRFTEAKDDYEECCEKMKDYDDEMKESEGLKPAPAPEKHQATGSVDGGDTTNGKVSDEEMKDQYHTTMKEMDDEEDEDGEDMDESEGLKPAPAPEKHITGSVDGGDVTAATVPDPIKEMDDEEDEDMDDMKESDDEDMEESDDKEDDDMDHMKEAKAIRENKEEYMAYAKKIIGNRDLSKMSDEEKSELFNKIDKGWNSEDEAGKDGKVD